MGSIPHSSVFETDDVTVSFWIFLLGDTTDGFKTIIHKGENSNELTPTIMLWGNENRLHVIANTEAYWNEGLDSKAIIKLKRWTHVTAIYSNQMLEIWVNGIRDN